MPIDPAYSREIIMDNYSYPRHKQLSDEPGYQSKHMASDSCIDDITVQAKIEDGKIKDVRFDGHACAISTSSTSILTELMEGKTVEEAQKIIDDYFAMVNGREFDPDLLQEAIAFEGVYKQPNRINCATIGWRAMQDMIDDSKKQQGEPAAAETKEEDKEGTVHE